MRNLEHFRKYSFGGLGVYGSEGDYEILGAWIWRGTEVTNEWKDHPSYDGFAFKRLNPKNPQDQERCAAYWLNTKEGDIVEGRPVFDIKIFK